MDEIVIIGDGGHGKVAQDIALLSNYNIVAVLDDKYHSPIQNNKGVLYGPISLCEKLLENEKRKLFVAIGDNGLRFRIIQALRFRSERFVSLIHPSAVVSRSSYIGVGTIVMANCVVQPNARIGNYTIVNTGAIVEHDNVIEDFVHISPNVTLCGNITIREGAHVGAGSVVIPNMEIGKWSIVGAGATVIRHVLDFETVVGVPAKNITKKGKKM